MVRSSLNRLVRKWRVKGVEWERHWSAALRKHVLPRLWSPERPQFGDERRGDVLMLILLLLVLVVAVFGGCCCFCSYLRANSLQHTL